MKNLIAFILIMALMANTYAQIETTALEGASKGQLKRIDSFPSKYVSDRNIDIWLPAGYNPENQYAVLYMHDGQMLFDSTKTWNRQEWGVDETMARLMEEGKIRNTIVVGIWNPGAGRHSDYFPQKPFRLLNLEMQDSLLHKVNRSEDEPLFAYPVSSDNYLKFITDELKPWVDSSYSTKSDRDNTFIAGSSMGGLISWYALCKYPKIFGGAACLSTHWPGTFETENNPIPDVFLYYLREHLPNPANHKIYFDYGTETLDALYEPYQKRADKIIKQKGYDPSSWMTQKFEGHDHSENAWRARLHIPLTFLLAE